MRWPIRAPYILHTEEKLVAGISSGNLWRKTGTLRIRIDFFLSGESGTTVREILHCLQIGSACIHPLPASTPERRIPGSIRIWIMAPAGLYLGMALPGHLLKTPAGFNAQTILLYNNYKGVQHSFMLLREIVAPIKNNVIFLLTSIE